MAIDATRLKAEEKIFWNLHDYNSALNALQKVNDYYGGSFFIVPVNNLLTSENLSARYSVDHGMTIGEVTSTMTYSALAQYYATYLNSLITQSEASSEATKKLAQEQGNYFASIIQTVTPLVKSATNFLLYGIILVILFMVYKTFIGK